MLGVCTNIQTSATILEQNHSAELAINAMHEIIRWQTPLSHMRRTATEDTELFGQQIKKHDRIALWYTSANRDESVFVDGEHIQVERENARRHLSFGYGIHRCVGARVAELQLTALIAELQKRRLRVNVVEAPEIVPACFVHGYKKMMVELVGKPRSLTCGARRLRTPNSSVSRSKSMIALRSGTPLPTAMRASFTDGEHIQVERENARRHLSFGYGIHRCVGARVAELQLTALIGELQKRRLRVNVVEAPEIVPACFVHGYKKMMVELERY